MCSLLNEALGSYALTQVFTPEEVAHWCGRRGAGPRPQQELPQGPHRARLRLRWHTRTAQVARSPVGPCRRFQNIDNVIASYVVEDPAAPGVLTDAVSFYSLPSSILGHALHKDLRAAYLYYYAAPKTPLKQLVSERPRTHAHGGQRRQTGRGRAAAAARARALAPRVRRAGPAGRSVESPSGRAACGR